MMNKLVIDNFKSLCTKEPIHLAPLSILCGSNSCGKSSLIQVLLMLSQTFSHRYAEDAVVLNGYMTRLGSFYDIINYKAKNDIISLSFKISTHSKQYALNDINELEINISFGKNTKSSKASLDDELHPALLNASFLIRRKTDNGDICETLEIERGDDQTDASRSNIYKIKNFETPDKELISRDYPDFEIIGVSKDGFLPSKIHLEYDHTKKIASQIMAMIVGGPPKTKKGSLFNRINDETKINLPRTFFEKLSSLLNQERVHLSRSLKIPTELERILKKSSEVKVKEEMLISIKEQMLRAAFPLKPEIIKQSFLKDENTSLQEWLQFLNSLDTKTHKNLTDFIDKHRANLQDVWYEGVEKERRKAIYRLHAFTAASSYLSAEFSRSIKYLGPLRNEPLAVYPSIGQTEPTDVGLKGEFTAAVLHINRGKKIIYLSPKIDESQHVTFEQKQSTLIDACKEWLSFLGVAKDVITKDKGKLGYEISVKTSTQETKAQDLTHVGVGVSQVLPIILMSLLSDEDDILIFEQPELHLHPKVQSRLCDFFLAMTQLKRQCIVETHSEYLINRLRLRIAQSRENNINKNCKVYFIEKDDGISKFREIAINDYGAIIDWPDDFFDQSDSEVSNILIEASKKKKEERSRNMEGN
ncbi:DUF3696 domain-containing protein [Aeromonas jandaei]|uniref:AAA family ATPase n=1 Tax=Aeromonas jandaei TaxID=650 RepID=UPI003BA24493